MNTNRIARIAAVNGSAVRIASAWAERVRKAGVAPDKVMAELSSSLKQSATAY